MRCTFRSVGHHALSLKRKTLLEKFLLSQDVFPSTEVINQPPRTEVIKVRKAEIKKRASKYEKMYKVEQKQLVQMRRQAKQTGNFFVEPEPKMMLVMRITGISNMERDGGIW